MTMMAMSLTPDPRGAQKRVDQYHMPVMVIHIAKYRVDGHVTVGPMPLAQLSGTIPAHTLQRLAYTFIFNIKSLDYGSMHDTLRCKALVRILHHAPKEC